MAQAPLARASQCAAATRRHFKSNPAIQAASGLALLLALQWGTLAERAPDEGPWGQKAADLMRALAPAAKSGSAESAFETRLARSAQGDADGGEADGDSDSADAAGAPGAAPALVAAAPGAQSLPNASRQAAAFASGPVASVPAQPALPDANAEPLAHAAPPAPPAKPSAALPAAAVAPGQKQLFLIAGDSLGDGYGQAARARFPRQSAWEAFDAGRHSTGLANAAYHDWPRALRDLVKQRKPQAVGLSVGANDTLDLRTDSGWARFGSDAWEAEYLARAEAFIRAGSESGAKVVVFGLPPMQNPAFNEKMRLIDQVLMQAAEETQALYVPANPVFGDKGFVREGVVNGRRAILRAGDGIHMTFAGYTVEVDDAIKALGIDPDASVASAKSPAPAAETSSATHGSKPSELAAQ